MVTEEEVLRRFHNSALLSATVDAVYCRLDRVSKEAATTYVTELITFAKDRERSRKKAAESENMNDPSDNEFDDYDDDLFDPVTPDLSLESDHECVDEPSTPTIILFDQAEVQRQLLSELPQSENSLESLLQIMATSGYEERTLVLAQPGMSQSCRELMTEFPNLAAAIELIAGAVFLAEQNQLPIQLPRLHLDGPPGCGKTQVLRRIADILQLPLVVVSMSALHGDFELVGCSRVFRGAEPGRLIKSLLALQVGNPIYLFDEAELGCTRHYGPLLSFIEDEKFTDVFFEMPFCTKFINKVFITNDALLLPAIRSRLICVDIKQPTAKEMRTILQRLYTNLRASNALFVGFPEAIGAELIEVLSKEPLRGARKLLEAALYRAACPLNNALADACNIELCVTEVNEDHDDFIAHVAGLLHELYFSRMGKYGLEAKRDTLPM